MDSSVISSAFHSGEQSLHEKLGIRDKMERFGSRVIRDHLPEQHQEFYHQLPFLFLGYQDQRGRVWASILYGDSGFVQSKDPKQLIINAKPIEGDPLNGALTHDMHLGLLGIELPTRRRNRLTARLKGQNEALHLNIVQTFGNCPQYIQTREIVPFDHVKPISIEDIERLDNASVELIQNADTFFVASHSSTKDEAASTGADVSHRGGKPGFIRVNDLSTITIPDYRGNFHFNTFGNFEVNPAAGLLFLDFNQGHILTLTGEAEVLWDDPDTQYFVGAERLWRFKVTAGRWLRNALPFRWEFGDYAREMVRTGSWDEVEKHRNK